MRKLFQANKQDLPHSASVTEVTDKLQLGKLRQRWYIQSTCAVTGEGLVEGFTWMAEAVKEAKKRGSVF